MTEVAREVSVTLSASRQYSDWQQRPAWRHDSASVKEDANMKIVRAFASHRDPSTTLENRIHYYM
jgi:hypothetical protein